MLVTTTAASNSNSRPHARLFFSVLFDDFEAATGAVACACGCVLPATTGV